MRHFDTRSVHVNSPGKKGMDSKVTPIFQTSSFNKTSLENLEAYFTEGDSYLYTRAGNPNTDELGTAVASLEQALEGVATSSGISAIYAGFLSVLAPGDHALVCEDIYGGTYDLIYNELKHLGVEVTMVSFDRDDLETEIKHNTKLIYTESVTNPLLRVENLQRVVELAKKHGIVSMVDNTFATPYLLQPYTQGFNLVVHSATKYIGGHSDVTAGVLVGDRDLINRAREKVARLGLILAPFEAWLTNRGLKTLSVRMPKQVENAKALADFLKRKDGVTDVYYPNTVSEKGNGAIVSIRLNPDNIDISRFFKSLSWVKIIATLAGVETSVSHPLSTSHRAMPASLTEKLGISKYVVRISVGIEDANDIIEAFNHAIEQSSC